MDRDKFKAALAKIIELDGHKARYEDKNDWLANYTQEVLKREIVKAARELIDAAGESENVEDEPPVNATYVTDIQFHGDGTVDVFYNGDNGDKITKRQFVYERKFPR